MITITSRVLRFGLGFILLLIFVSVGAPAAFASAPGPGGSTHVTGSGSADVAISIKVVPGPLLYTVGTPSTPTSSANGHVIRYTVPVTVVDATGSGNGWTLSAQNNAVATSQNTSTTLIQDVSATGNEGSVCHNAIDVASAPIVMSSDTLASSAPVFQAPQNTGMGKCFLTLTISVFSSTSVPASAISGAFSFSLMSGSTLP